MHGQKNSGKLREIGEWNRSAVTDLFLKKYFISRLVEIFQRMFLCSSCKYSNMKDQGSQKGKSKKADAPAVKTPAGTEVKTIDTKPVPLTAKEKIAANQRNKKRR